MKVSLDVPEELHMRHDAYAFMKFMHKIYLIMRDNQSRKRHFNIFFIKRKLRGQVWSIFMKRKSTDCVT